MNELVLIFGIHSGPGIIELIPIIGLLTGIIIPLYVILWIYHDAINKRETELNFLMLFYIIFFKITDRCKR